MSSNHAKTLKDITELIVDCEHKTAPAEDHETGYLSIRTPNIGRGRLILEGANQVSYETYIEWTNRAIPRAGDLILAREAPVGNVAIVPPNLTVCLGQRTVLIRPDENQVEPDYLVYLLNGEEVQGKFWAYASGATVPHLNMADIRSLELPELPPRDVQRRIAAILSAYDDLIENNTQRIRILEEMAQALYREWFVHFRYPGHEDVPLVESALGPIPAGWEVKPVDQLLEHHIGGGWGKEEPENDHSMPAYVIRGTDIPSVRYSSIDDCPYRFHKESQLNSRRLLPGDIVFEVSGGSKDQPVGRALLITQHLLSAFDADVIPASFCKLLRIDTRKILPEILYFHLLEIYENREIMKYQVQSTGISNFKFAYFREHELVIMPSNDVQNRFANFIVPLWDQIQLLGQRNAVLREARDLLLPRLVSGEIDVSELEILTS